MSYYISASQFTVTFDKETRQKEYHSTTGTFRVMVVTPHIVFTSEDNVQYYDTDGDITYLDAEEAEKEKLIPISKDQYSHLASIEKNVNALFNISMLGNESSDCRVSAEEIDAISCEAGALYRRLYKAYGEECKAVISETTQLLQEG